MSKALFDPIGVTQFGTFGAEVIMPSLETTPEFADLVAQDRVALEHAIREFRLTGIALDEGGRERFAAIMVELSQCSTAFSNAVLDATDAWHEQVTDESALAGLSPADKAMLAAAARAKGLEGWLVTLQYPSVNAVLTFAEDRGLRERVYTAFGTRASDQGPDAGRYDNTDRIARILELRHEAARLLGYPDPVQWSLATKMAPDAGEVLTFLRDLAARARPSAERDLAEMQDYATSALGIDDLQPWDQKFVADRLRRAQHAIDEAEVRAYFPVDRVLAGWEALLERLFGITLVRRCDVPLWHVDARYYDVRGGSGEVVAGLYLDLHARTGKRGGAWIAPARPRRADGDTIAVPMAYLTCNFAPHDGDRPALLSHDDVVVLLHETGHALHHMLTRVELPSIAGTSGFEWDSVELPSQLMEDFAWDRDVLTAMSGHVETGAALPADLFDRMLAARRFHAGFHILRQIEVALFDLLLHLGTMGSDPIEVLEAVRDEVAVVPIPRWHRFPHAFSHIFAGGYASGYYRYLWAEVLAADGFQAFDEAVLVDRATDERFLAEVSSRGATPPAAESFHAFRGRDADPVAMLERQGLV